MVFSNFQDILLKGYFGHFTRKDVNVIFEILEGNFVIFIGGVKSKIFGIGRV